MRTRARRRGPPAIAWALALALVPLASVTAEPYEQEGLCDSAGWPAAHRIEITGGSAGTTLYIDDENFFTGNGIWIYVESNGLWEPKLPGVYLEGLSNANLQRGYYHSWHPDDQEICFDRSDAGPDLIIY